MNKNTEIHSKKCIGVRGNFSHILEGPPNIFNVVGVVRGKWLVNIALVESIIVNFLHVI